jgi:Flp pilus assembly pilin Flp
MYLMNTSVHKFDERRNGTMKIKVIRMKNAIHKLGKGKSGDATLNWILGVVISVAIVAALITLVSSAIPTLWTDVMDKITAVLS